MRISRREQILLGVLGIVAVAVLMMHSGETAVQGEQEPAETRSVTRILTQFRQVRPLPAFADGSVVPETDNQRNIFRYGQQSGQAVPSDEPTAGVKDMEAIQAAAEAAALEAERRQTGPTPPAVDFEVLGIIETTTGSAAVISRTPELFVVREMSRFLETFILKEVTRDGITIGYIGFEETTFLPLETGRGF